MWATTRTTGGTTMRMLGRRTYAIVAAFGPDAPTDEGGDALNGATKYVASRTPTP